MRHIFFIFLFSLVFCTGISAKTGVTYHSDEVDNGYNFILYTPDSAATVKPLLITLHSRSSSGKNLQDVDNFGTIDAIESGMEIDAYVVAPQSTGTDWDPEKIMRVVDYVVANNNVDPNRIYAIGMSMGGNGVANLTAAYSEIIAAAMIIAGSLTQGSTTELSKVPLWVIRGTNDREEAIRRTDNMVVDIREHDSSRIVYSKIIGLDHRQHERILYMPCFYEWLMSHNLSDLHRPIHPTFEVTTKMLNNSYEGLRLHKDSAANRKNRGKRQGGLRRPMNIK